MHGSPFIAERRAGRLSALGRCLIAQEIRDDVRTFRLASVWLVAALIVSASPGSSDGACRFDMSGDKEETVFFVLGF